MGNARFFVSYVVQDKSTGSNLGFHASLLVSHSKGENSPIEVEAAYGFYAMENEANPMQKRKWPAPIENSLRLFQLEPQHGLLCHEEMRFLDKGEGIRGFTFELTESAWNTLKEKIADRQQGEQQAIRDAVEALKISTQVKEKYKRYPYEHHAKDIFLHEQQVALKTGRPTRLYPFEVHITTIKGVLTTQQSKTCKTYLLDLLAQFLSGEEVSQLRDFNAHPTIPRFSGPLEPIPLYSTGPVVGVHTRSKGMVYSRTFGQSDTHLFWVTSPQALRTLTERLAFKPVSKTFTDVFAHWKTYTQSLQSIENALLQSTLPEETATDRLETIALLQEHYTRFSSLAQYPPSTEIIEKACQDAQILLHSIHLAITRGVCENISLQSFIKKLYPKTQNTIAEITKKHEKTNSWRFFSQNTARTKEHEEEENWGMRCSIQ